MNQYNDEQDLQGKYAWLKEPYRGYNRILLLEKTPYKWLVEICGSGLEIEVYEDEFELED